MEKNIYEKPVIAPTALELEQLIAESGFYSPDTNLNVGIEQSQSANYDVNTGVETTINW